MSVLAASDNSVLFKTIGLAFAAIALATVAHLVLAFPSGTLETSSERTTSQPLRSIVAVILAAVA